MRSGINAQAYKNRQVLTVAERVVLTAVITLSVLLVCDIFGIATNIIAITFVAAISAVVVFATCAVMKW